MTTAPERRVTVTVERPSDLPAGALLITPKPFGHWGETPIGLEVSGAAVGAPICAENSRCEALIADPGGAQGPIRIEYCLALDDSGAPDWIWEGQENRHTLASPELSAAAKALVADTPDARAAVDKLARHTASIFGYGHVEEKFNEGVELVPIIAGLARGSCVDINTYLLAAARAAGLRGQYIAGYWFHPEKQATTDMHCWLVFAPDEGAPVFWDVAHGLKWAETLGAAVTPGLNPAGGRRVGMSCGRGLAFETPNGRVEISHFSEPMWVLPDGALRETAKTIAVTDPAVDA